MGSISLVGAFVGGLLSFLSPCVLPLVPVYLASLYGPEIFDTTSKRLRMPLFIHSLSFVVGFAIVFIALGAIAGLTGYAVNLNYSWLSRVAGSLLVVFGLFMLLALKVPWLNFEKRLNVSVSGTTSYLRSFFIGAIFSMGWTPCIGFILGGILAIASVEATAWKGAYLLAIYSLGLGIPFLIIGFAFDSMLPLLRRMQRYTSLIYIISGLLLIVVGVLILTNQMVWLSSL